MVLPAQDSVRAVRSQRASHRRVEAAEDLKGVDVNVVVALLLFSVVMTAICVKARAVVPALVSGGLAVLLVCSIWNGLPGVISEGAQGAGEVGAEVVSTIDDN